MTVTVVSPEPGAETPPVETVAAETEVVETTAAEAAVVTAEASIALAEAEAAAVTLRSEDEIRQLIGGLETWRAGVDLELSALTAAVSELRAATALMTGAVLAQETSMQPSTELPQETVAVETPQAAVTITEVSPELSDATQSAQTRPRRRWT